MCRFVVAFGRERVAEQSTIQRTLKAFTEENVCQLREAVEAIGRRYSRLPSHPLYERQMLILEVDLTGSEGLKEGRGLSTKGYFSGSPNATGRQLVRAIAPTTGRSSSVSCTRATPPPARS